MKAATSLAEIAQTIKSASSFIVTSHASPDPDAVGSASAVALALQALGKSVTLYLADPAPQKLSELIEGISIVQTVPASRVDVLLIIDTASRKRIGPEFEAVMSLAATSINIDHHVSNDGWATFNYIDGNAAASCEIVIQLFDALGLPLSRQVANLLFAGIIDDTGSFRFSNTSVQVLQAAARLVSCGADPLFVANQLYAKQPIRALRLRAAGLSTVQLHGDGKFATLAVTREMLASCGAQDEDVDGLVDELRALDGTQIVALLRELPDNLWKISLRSKDSRFDVNAIAGRFGGGGHRAAAGCRISGDQRTAQAQLLGAVNEALLADKGA